MARAEVSPERPGGKLGLPIRLPQPVDAAFISPLGFPPHAEPALFTGTCGAKLDLHLNAEGAYDVVGAREAPVTSTAQVLQCARDPANQKGSRFKVQG